MAYSSLKRKTPLKAKSGFKPRKPFLGRAGQLSRTGDKKPTEGTERPRKARKSTKSSVETHLDIVFSLYIRLRDAMSGGMTRCISCGRAFPFERVQCGHYFTRHNMSVRWDEENCHAQCVECNCFKSGNIDGYTPALIAKIGQDAYDALCERARKERKWSGDELRRLVRHYTAEVKRLSKEKEINVKL